MPKDKNFYHLIIVGAGPAGLSASIYAQRAGVDTLVLEKLGLVGRFSPQRELKTIRDSHTRYLLESLSAGSCNKLRVVE